MESPPSTPKPTVKGTQRIIITTHCCRSTYRQHCPSIDKFFCWLLGCHGLCVTLAEGFSAGQTTFLITVTNAGSLAISRLFASLLGRFFNVRWEELSCRCRCAGSPLDEGKPSALIDSCHHEQTAKLSSSLCCWRPFVFQEESIGCKRRD